LGFAVKARKVVQCSKPLKTWGSNRQKFEEWGSKTTCGGNLLRETKMTHVTSRREKSKGPHGWGGAETSTEKACHRPKAEGVPLGQGVLLNWEEGGQRVDAGGRLNIKKIPRQKVKKRHKNNNN